MRKALAVAFVLLAVLGILAQPIPAELRIYEKEGAVTVDRETYENRFTPEEALKRLGQMREALFSFVKLTDYVRYEKLVPEEQLLSKGNTGWETQALGFANWSNTVEGTLRRQHYDLKMAELELTRLRLEKGEATQEDCEKAKVASEKAEQAMQKFWDEFQIAD